MAIVIPPQNTNAQQATVSGDEEFPYVMYHLETLLRLRVALLNGPVGDNRQELYEEIATPHLIPAVIVRLPGTEDFV